MNVPTEVQKVWWEEHLAQCGNNTLIAIEGWPQHVISRAAQWGADRERDRCAKLCDAEGAKKDGTS